MVRFPICLLLWLAVSLSASASEWGQFRGPLFNGSTDETNLPESWSTTEGVAWSVEMPGASAATPIVWQDHVFVSSTNIAQDKLLAMCYDRKTGQQLWSHEIEASGIRRDSRSNFAAPTPATDGERVIFFYGNGELAAFDFAGNPTWRRNVQEDYGEFAFLWTFSTSPLIYDGKLYLQVLQRDVQVSGRGQQEKGIESYLLAMDPGTGKTLWRHVRPSKAVAESREAFSTPVPFEHNGRKEILISGGDAISGHDPETGREYWRWGTWNPTRIGHWRLVPSPAAGKGVVLACAPKKNPIYAVKAGGNGVLDDSALAWVSRDQAEVSSDVTTPAFHDGDFFVLDESGFSVSRVDPRTGKVEWTCKLPRGAKYEASPTVADGKVYVINFLGTVVVVNAASGEVISEISMDEPSDDDPVRSSIAVAHGQLFIRTTHRLFCVGN